MNPNLGDSKKTFSITEVTRDSRLEKQDELAVEEPLEIRVVSGPSGNRKGRSLSITMRTPGLDFELAVGFLFTEGIVSAREHVVDLEYCGTAVKDTERQNIVRVYLAEDLEVDLRSLQRNFYMTSSCGICGKTSLDAIEVQRPEPIESNLEISSKLIHELPGKLRTTQTLFQDTGGIHAAGLFDGDGEQISVCEDVGRHNAVDKLIGGQVLAGNVELNDRIIVVSGRASFELMQKTAMAGIPMLIAVGAPSSLAAELAKRFNITLVGFTSTDRFNIYSGEKRVV